VRWGCVVTIVTTRLDGAKPGFKLSHDISVRRRRGNPCPVDGLEIQFRRRGLFLCLILFGEGSHTQFRRSNHWICDGGRSVRVDRC
jgi:hypothetical protein